MPFDASPSLLAAFQEDTFPHVVTASQASVVAWYDQDEGRVCVWSPDVGTPRELIRTPFHPDDYFWDMTLSEDGTLLAVWSGGEKRQDAEVLILLVESGQVIRRLSFDNPDVYLIVHLSTVHGLFVQMGDELYVFEPPFTTATTLRRRGLFGDALFAHPAGKHIISQHHGHGIFALDMQTLSVWCLVLELSGATLGFSASGRHLLVFDDVRREIHWVDLEDGVLSRTVPLETEGWSLGYYPSTFSFTFSTNTAWLLAHAWSRVQEAYFSVCWDTHSGAILEKTPYIFEDEDDDYCPEWVTTPTHLVRVDRRIEVFSLASLETCDVSLPHTLAHQNKIAPIPPSSAPLLDNVITEIVRLGGCVGDPMNHPPELPMALAQLATIQWPDCHFEGDVGDWEFVFLRWISGGPLGKEYRCAHMARWEIVAEADGGNVYLIANCYDACPQNPRIYRISHDNYGDDPLIPLGPLSLVLESLSSMDL